jgi:hypothetical protein
MRLAALLAAGLLAGCSLPRISVTYQSEPPGARLFYDGTPMGTTPKVLSYEQKPEFQGGGCQQASGMSVQWASGARQSTASVPLCASAGLLQTYVFTRPDGPGLDTDLEAAKRPAQPK